MIALAAAALLLAAPCFAQMDAREQEYYSWCRGQGGTPEGSGWSLHCTPPAGGGGTADGAVIPAPTNVRDAVMFGVMKGLTQGLIKGIQDSAAQRRAAAAAPAQIPSYNQWQQQQRQPDADESYRRAQEERRRADEDAKRQELQNELVMPGESAPSSKTPELVIPEAPKPSAPIADGGVRVTKSAPNAISEPLVDCRGAKRRSLECVDSDAIDVPPPPFLAKDDEAKALANEKRLISELDQAHEDHDIQTMERASGEWLKNHAQVEYETKGKGYLLSGEAGGQVLGVINRVEGAGEITKNYAKNTLDAFRGETTSAACVLGSAAPNSCWDSFHEQEARVASGESTLDRDTAGFVAKSYGAGSVLSKARHAILGGDGAEVFFENYR